MTLTPTRSWNQVLREQLDFHYRQHLRPRLEGLTDDEYFWEPAPGSWNVRPREQATSSHAAGGGDLVVDYAWPEPDPAPVTTIAWRLAHVIAGCFAMRTANHFGGPPRDYTSWTYAGTADEALEQLDGALVQPLQVVDEQDQWLFRACKRLEEPTEDHVEPVLGVLRLQINRNRLIPDQVR